MSGLDKAAMHMEQMHCDQPRGYLNLSRGQAASLVFILPLLIIYEIGVTCLGSGFAGAADMLKSPLFLLGSRGTLLFNLGTIAVVIVALHYLLRRQELKAFVFPLMLMESFIYGLALVPVMGLVMQGLGCMLSMGERNAIPTAALVASTGAGVYEELIFRGLLVGATFRLMTSAFKVPRLAGGVVSIVGAGVLFSLMHFVGPTGEPFSFLHLFARFVAALILSAVFMLRGLGITCYTHAVYNVLVIVGT